MPKGPRTAEVARRLVDAYVTSLRQHLPTYCIRQLDKLPGAQEHQLTRLHQVYPGTPTELLYFLERVNGTCWESPQAPRSTAPPRGGVAAVATGAVSSVAAAAVLAKPSTTTATDDDVTLKAEKLRSAAAAAAPLSLHGATAAATSTTAAATGDGAAATAAPTTSADGAASKPVAAASSAAASASAAAAYIKSQFVKTVNTIAAPRPRRPLPHFVALPILGSPYSSCPYYLKSVEQMLLAEQQFPPPSANMPDVGEGWTPPPPSSSPTPPLPQGPLASRSSSTTGPVPTACATGQPPEDVRASHTDPAAPDSPATIGGSDKPPSAAAAAVGEVVALTTSSIASVYHGCTIVYGSPPDIAAALAASSLAEPITSSAAAAASMTTPPNNASADGAHSKENTSGLATATAPAAAVIAENIAATALHSESHRVVYVDPRIDIHVGFHQWLVFADSVQPHVHGSPQPTIPDADPAKVEAAEGTTISGSAAAPPSAEARESSRPQRHFAVSRLYIDFKPVKEKGGLVGQVIQFVHGKPASFSVVADDFGEYLKGIMSEEFEFMKELEDDDDDDGDEEGEEGEGTDKGKDKDDSPDRGNLESNSEKATLPKSMGSTPSTEPGTPLPAADKDGQVRGSPSSSTGDTSK